MSTTPEAMRLLMDAAHTLRSAYEREQAVGHTERAEMVNALIINVYGVAGVVLDSEEAAS